MHTCLPACSRQAAARDIWIADVQICVNRLNLFESALYKNPDKDLYILLSYF